MSSIKFIDTSTRYSVSSDGLTAYHPAYWVEGGLLCDGKLERRKYYWEILISTPTTKQSDYVGVAAVAHNVDGQDFGDYADEWVYSYSGDKINGGVAVAFGSTFYKNDIIGVAYDPISGKLWFSKNGVWQGGGDPPAGTGEAFSGLPSGLYAGWGQTYDLGQATVRATEALLTHAIPDGFVVPDFFSFADVDESQVIENKIPASVVSSSQANVPVRMKLSASSGLNSFDFTDMFDALAGRPGEKFLSGTNYSLSNYDKSATKTLGGGSWDHVKTDITFSEGKYYWECVVDIASGSDNQRIGLVRSTTSTSQYPGEGSDTYGYDGATGYIYTNGSSSVYGDAFTTGDVIGIAFDVTSGKVWFSKNNVWQNSGDPEAGTGEAFTGITGIVVPAFGTYDLSAKQTSYYQQADLTYTPPEFFLAGELDHSKRIAVVESFGGTQLDVEVDSWDSAAYEAELFVKFPSLYSASDTEFKIYYDDNQGDNVDYIGQSFVQPDGVVLGPITDDTTEAPGTFTWRVVVSASALSGSGNMLAIRFMDGANYTIDACYAGIQAFTGDVYDIKPSTLVEVTKGGLSSISVSSGDNLSDIFKLATDSSTNVVISFSCTSQALRSIATVPSGVSAYFLADVAEAGISDVTGYGLGGQSPCVAELIALSPDKKVWADDYAAAFHMSQYPDGTAPQIVDSTPNVRALTSQGSMTAEDLVAGEVGTAIEFDGVDDSLRVDTVKDLSVCTIEIIAKGTSDASNVIVGSYVDAANSISVIAPATDTIALIEDGVGTIDSLAGFSLPDTFEHIAITVDGNGITIYNLADGTSSYTANTTAFIDNELEVSGNSAPWEGPIDEIKISTVARSADWLDVQYNANVDTLIWFGPPNPSIIDEFGPSIGLNIAAKAEIKSYTELVVLCDIGIGTAMSIGYSATVDANLGIGISGQAFLSDPNYLQVNSVIGIGAEMSVSKNVNLECFVGVGISSSAEMLAYKFADELNLAIGISNTIDIKRPLYLMANMGIGISGVTDIQVSTGLSGNLEIGISSVVHIDNNGDDPGECSIGSFATTDRWC